MCPRVVSVRLSFLINPTRMPVALVIKILDKAPPPIKGFVALYLIVLDEADLEYTLNLLLRYYFYNNRRLFLTLR